MRTTVPKALVALAFGIILVLGPVAIWWAASPYQTLSGLANASYDGDEDTFQSYIDMPALRRNALAREEDGIRQSGGSSPTIHLDEHAIATHLMGPVIDRAFSGRTIFDLVHHKDHTSGRDVSYVLVRDGINYFEVRFLAPSTLVLKFRRHGLRWRIVDIWVDGSVTTVTT